MKRRKFSSWFFVATAGGMAYPFLVYYGLAVVSPTLLVLAGLTLIGMRLLDLRHRPGMKIWGDAFFIAALALCVLLCLDASMAAKAYPIIISLSVASVFLASLFSPPTIIERIARLQEPDLPPSGILYTRRVTMIWVIFLVANAAISAVTAIWGTLAQWTLWNGLLSYICMGTLFAGEWLVRPKVRP